MCLPRSVKCEDDKRFVDSGGGAVSEAGDSDSIEP